jgi:hypothetical protein
MGIIDVVDNINLLQKRRNKQQALAGNQTESSCRLGCMPDAEDLPDYDDQSSGSLRDK